MRRAREGGLFDREVASDLAERPRGRPVRRLGPCPDTIARRPTTRTGANGNTTPAGGVSGGGRDEPERAQPIFDVSHAGEDRTPSSEVVADLELANRSLSRTPLWTRARFDPQSAPALGRRASRALADVPHSIRPGEAIVEDKRARGAIGRRETIRLLGVGIAASGLLAACGKKEEGPSGAQPGSASPTPQPAATPAAAPEKLSCTTPLDTLSKQNRLVLQYKDPAVTPEKRCELCSQFVAGKYGDCGGCNLFTGPVSLKGGCASFSPKAGAAAPAKSG